MDQRDVGGYRLIRQIGAGGMGTVFEAENGGGERVALKLLHPSLAADERSRARLQREVTLLRRVSSSHVAQVIDAELDAVEPFIVTELVNGLTLEKDVQENGIYTDEDLLELGEKLADALTGVHEAGIVHRDLKPSNVMIAEGEPILIDFGIAQAEDATRLTQTGALALTPGYCDPRVLYGAEADEEADWWAMAAVLAYAATGEAPFGEGRAPTVMQRVLNGRPSLPDLNAQVEAAFRAALAPKLADRMSYRDLLGAIADYSRGVSGEQPSWQPPQSDGPTAVLGATLVDTQRAWESGNTVPIGQTGLIGQTEQIDQVDPYTLALERAELDSSHGKITPEPSGVKAGSLKLESSLPQDVSSHRDPATSLSTLALIDPQRLPPWAREPRRARFLVGVAWVALTAGAVRWPGWVCSVFVLGLFVLDVLGTSFSLVRDRRLRRGAPTIGDTTMVLVRLPLTILVVAVRTAIVAAVAGAIGFGALWLSVRTHERNSGISGNIGNGGGGEFGDMSTLGLSVDVLASANVTVTMIVVGIAIAAVWLSPSSKNARIGARIATGGALQHRLVRILVAILLVACATLTLYATQSSAVTPSWIPLM